VADTSEAVASTLAVIPVVGRADLASAAACPDEFSRQQKSGVNLLAEAIYTLWGIFAHVLVVSRSSAGWSAPRPIRWLNPRSDADFLEAITEFDRILIHDLLCPLADPQFFGEMAAADGQATAAVRPLVETVKAMRGDVVAGTLDRDVLRMVTSPIVVDRDVLAEVPDVVEGLSDFAVLVSRLRAVTPVALAPAPAGAVRVSDEADLRLLALHGPS
jgi:hypothetical protein